LTLHVLHGRDVRTWIDGQSMQSGRHLEAYNVSGLPAGTYIYQLSTSTGTVRSAKLQLLGH